MINQSESILDDASESDSNSVGIPGDINDEAPPPYYVNGDHDEGVDGNEGDGVNNAYPAYDAGYG